MTSSDQHPSAPKPTFAELINDTGLVEGLTKLNITEPTDVQARTIPVALQNGDIIVEAKTGSGKTLAFMLPILSKIRSRKPTRATVALIVTPTRELAVQVKAVVESLTSDIVPTCLIGGASGKDQERQLRNDARIVVGTPGRIQDFIRQRILVLRNCSTFVLDEADEMLSMGFVDEVRTILSRLPAERQGMFFSATITPRVSALANSFLRSPQSIIVEVDKSEEPLTEHFFCTVDGGVASKIQVLGRLFAEHPNNSAIVFCNTKSDTELVEVCLRRRGYNAARINSDLTQRQRDEVLTSLRSGELKYLIATDVAARGIDIKELEMVINYSLPNEPEVYVHRTGRTGRAGASGLAISLVGPQDFGSFYGLKKHRNAPIKEIFFPEVEVKPEGGTTNSKVAA